MRTHTHTHTGVTCTHAHTCNTLRQACGCSWVPVRRACPGRREGQTGRTQRADGASWTRAASTSGGRDEGDLAVPRLLGGTHAEWEPVGDRRLTGRESRRGALERAPRSSGWSLRVRVPRRSALMCSPRPHCLRPLAHWSGPCTSIRVLTRDSDIVGGRLLSGVWREGGWGTVLCPAGCSTTLATPTPVVTPSRGSQKCPQTMPGPLVGKPVPS